MSGFPMLSVECKQLDCALCRGGICQCLCHDTPANAPARVPAAQLRTMLNRITLPPAPMGKSWTVELDEPGQVLVVRLVTTDSGWWTEPEKADGIVVSHRMPVPLIPPAGGWDYWVLDCLAKVVVHELCEGFLVDGQPEFHPHRRPDGELRIAGTYGILRADPRVPVPAPRAPKRV